MSSETPEMEFETTPDHQADISFGLQVEKVLKLRGQLNRCVYMLVIFSRSS